MIQRIAEIKADDQLVFDQDNYRLIICLEHQGITLAVSNSERRWVAAEVLYCAAQDLENLPQLMEQLHQQSFLLAYNLLQTAIVLRTPNAVLVPKTLQAGTAAFIELHTSIQPGDKIVEDVISNKMLVALKADAQKLSLFTTQFPQASLHSSLASLVKYSMADADISGNAVMHLVFCNGLIEQTIIQNNQLLLARCFVCSGEEDMNYQLLNSCKQLHILPATVLVKVQGLIEAQSPLYAALEKYFANITFSTADTSTWDSIFKDVPPHYFTALIETI